MGVTLFRVFDQGLGAVWVRENATLVWLFQTVIAFWVPSLVFGLILSIFVFRDVWFLLWPWGDLARWLSKYNALTCVGLGKVAGKFVARGLPPSFVIIRRGATFTAAWFATIAGCAYLIDWIRPRPLDSWPLICFVLLATFLPPGIVTCITEGIIKALPAVPDEINDEGDVEDGDAVEGSQEE